MSSGANRPTISVVVPAYNAERFVAEAIGSVLEQSVPATECVVVDDGSRDGTAELVEKFGPPVRLVRQENRGVSGARNRGVAESQGNFLAFLDADDTWQRQRLERQVDALTASPAHDAVVCATRVVDAQGVELGTIVPDARLTAERLLLWQATTVSVSSNLLVSREAFEEIGGFDESLSTSADWALTFRLIERGPLLTVDEPLVTYRVHDSNMSADVHRFERDMLHAYDKVFAGAAPDIARLRRRAYANLHRTIAGSFFVERRLGGFARHAGWSLLAHPSTLPYFLGMPARRLRRRRAGAPDPLTSLRAGGRPRG